MDKNRICRLCGNGNNFTELFSNTSIDLLEKITVCLNLSIDKNDELPKVICVDCENKLNEFFYFREECHKTNTKLNKLFKSNESDEDVKTDFFLNNDIKVVAWTSELPKDMIFNDNSLDKIENKDNIEIKSELDDSMDRIEYTNNSENDENSIEEDLNSEKKDQVIEKLNEVKENLDEVNSTKGIEKGIYIWKRNRNKNVNCHICNKKYSRTDILNRHLKIIHKIFPPKKITKTDPNVKKRDRYKIVTCNICDKTYTRVDRLNYHLKVIHNVIPPKAVCDICQMNFPNKPALNHHIKTIHIEAKVLSESEKVEKEIEKIRKKLNENEDYKEVDGIFKFVCKICDKSFMTNRSLRIHGEMHINLKKNVTYPCKFCHKQFSIKHKYNDHVRRVHERAEERINAPLIQCNICNKPYQEQYIKQHMYLVHEGIKPFKCDICGSSFSLKKILIKHQIIHTGERNYQCEICKKKFKTKSYLRDHLKIHSNRPTTSRLCDICGQTYSARGRKFHMSLHSDSLTYKCDLCDNVFRSNYTLKIHKLRHQNIKPHKCEFCGKSFAEKHRLKTHIKKTHTNDNLTDFPTTN